METTTNCISLISGDFTPDEARGILLNMINNEIAFYTMKNFSRYERFGTEDSISQQHIHHLTEVRLDVLEQLLLAGSLECTVRIDSTVQIMLLPGKAVPAA